MTKLEKAFKKMGANVQIKKGSREPSIRKTRGRARTISRPRTEGYFVDIKNGKFIFDLGESGAKVTIQEVDLGDMHILVNVQTEPESRRTNRKGNLVISKEIVNDKWLCGYDDRDWFVAAVVGKTIIEAKQNLKPKEVLAVEGIVKPKKRNKSKNEAFIRQGEWFFVPANNDILNPIVVHNDEPISRPGGGKPHIVENIYRAGGRMVYVKGDSVLEPEKFHKLESHQKSGYTQRQADANVYGRGYVKHPDHPTIHLKGWHRIFMNTEVRDKKGATMVFLD